MLIWGGYHKVKKEKLIKQIKERCMYKKHHVLLSYLDIKRRKIHIFELHFRPNWDFNFRPSKLSLLAMRDKLTTRSFRQAINLLSKTTASWTRGRTLHGRWDTAQTRIVGILVHIAYEIKYKHKHCTNSQINIYMTIVKKFVDKL